MPRRVSCRKLPGQGVVSYLCNATTGSGELGEPRDLAGDITSTYIVVLDSVMLSSLLTPPDSSISVAILEQASRTQEGRRNACCGTDVRDIR